LPAAAVDIGVRKGFTAGHLSTLDSVAQLRPAAAQAEAAAARVEQRESERAARIAQLQEPGGVGRADAPERVAARLDRLSRYWSRAPRPRAREEVPRGATDEVLSTALSRGMAWAQPEDASLETAGRVLERIIGTPDFVGINYLETGVVAAHAVGRVNIGDGGGRVVGYGTGSLVAPRVLLTNHHVLPDAETARASAIEFDFEDGPDGQPRQAHRFPLAPDALFVADEALDFALVAVEAAESALEPYGYNPMIEAEGKAIIGEFVTIVQHPRGERKQIALRDNRIVDVVEEFLHYEADTEPGSSGSLVFNDQWETVALHHASVPAPDRGDQGGFINEGIRISRIIGHIRGQSLSAQAAALASPVVRPESDRPVGVAPAGGGGGTEAVDINPDYSNRAGYDADFLGSGEHSVPLPELSDELASQAAVSTDADGAGPPHVLPYHHFSVVVNKDRKLAFFTAVNIDGELARPPRRETDQWSFDPRIAATDQTGEAAYEDNALDRGHLVRRLDPAWGESAAVAKAANDDTFHFTNCAPQHEKFNRNKTTWAGLEDYVLENADNENFRVNVFSGPVFAGDDVDVQGVKLPRQFWKVVVMAKKSGGLSATAYLLSQEKLLDGLEAEPEFVYGAFKTFQVPVSEIERLTGLSLGSLPDHDPLATQEAAAVAPRELENEAQAIL
jgi:endonuclease G